MSLIEHAKREFKLAGYTPLDQEQPDDPDKWIQENVLELLKVFSKQGHSGFSASYCIRCFTELASFRILTPLTGNDDEWTLVAKDLYQNNRCPHIFKQDGNAYNIDGKVFSDDNGSTWYTNAQSRTPVIFPYVPKEPERILCK